LLGDTDLYLAIDSFNLESFESVKDRALVGLSSLNGKSSIMKWANNLIAYEDSLGKTKSEVGTFTLNGVYFSLVVNNKDGIFRLGTHQKLSHFSIL
jgi:hypothetical protein